LIFLIVADNISVANNVSFEQCESEDFKSCASNDEDREVIYKKNLARFNNAPKIQIS
jgi:hypothetical protein